MPSGELAMSEGSSEQGPQQRPTNPYVAYSGCASRILVVLPPGGRGGRFLDGLRMEDFPRSRVRMGSEYFRDIGGPV